MINILKHTGIIELKRKLNPAGFGRLKTENPPF
jgi:hypothetical protein